MQKRLSSTGASLKKNVEQATEDIIKHNNLFVSSKVIEKGNSCIRIMRLAILMNLKTRKCAVITVCIITAFILIYSILHVVKVSSFWTLMQNSLLNFILHVVAIQDLFPEIDMVLNSPCSNPLSQWDGKILKFQVWFNAMKRKPSYFNIHYEHNINKSYPAFTDYRRYRSSIKKPVIYWGTHHKTGSII